MHVYPHSFFCFLRPMEAYYIHCFASGFFFFSPHFVYLGDPSPLVNEDLAFLFLENECVAFHCMDELCIRLFSNSGSKKPYMYHFKHVLA